MDQAERDGFLYGELDRHVRYYKESVFEDIKTTILFKCSDQFTFRSMDSAPLYYDTCSATHIFDYVFPGHPTDINAPEKCIGLTRMTNDVCSTIIDIYTKDKTIAWNVICFDITRDQSGVVFKGTLCLYMQTTDNLIDETIDNLRKLKGEPPRVIEGYLRGAMRSFYVDIKPTDWRTKKYNQGLPF